MSRSPDDEPWIPLWLVVVVVVMSASAALLLTASYEFEVIPAAGSLRQY